MNESLDQSQDKKEEYPELIPKVSQRFSLNEIFSAPKELWLIIYIKFCIYGALITFNNLKSLYLTEVLGYSDLDIVVFFFVTSFLDLAVLLCLGSIPDILGIKNSLILSCIMLIFAFTSIILIENRNYQLSLFILLSLPAETLQVTALELGLKKYTMYHYRTLAITLFTTIKFFVTLLGGVGVEFILAYGNEEKTAYNIFFSVCIFLISTGLLASLFLRNLDVNYRDEIEVFTIHNKTYWKTMKELMVLKRYWRVLGVISLVIVVKSVFSQQTIALSLYMDREFGNNSHYGLIIILNQVIVILLTPFFMYLTYDRPPYDIFIIGGFFASVSPLCFLLGANYYSVVGFILLSSVGESLYAPRIIEYCLEIAPKGRESGVIAMTHAPGSLCSGISGAVAGLLMNGFCPDSGASNCELVWVFISVSVMPAVFLMIVCRKCLEQPLFESNPFISCSSNSKAN